MSSLRISSRLLQKEGRPLEIESSRRVKSLLSISRKAGKLACGGDTCLSFIRRGRARLVVLAVDASGNTQKRFRDKTKFYETPLIEMFTMEELGAAIGTKPRAVAAILDENIAIKINQILEGGA